MAPKGNVTGSENGPEVIMKGEERIFRLVTPMEGYHPGDVTVRPTENSLLILSTKSEEVIKSFALEESLDPFAIEAHMSEDSILTVEAPLSS